MILMPPAIGCSSSSKRRPTELFEIMAISDLIQDNIPTGKQNWLMLSRLTLYMAY